MTQPMNTMPTYTRNQRREYSHACRQLPNVQIPASGTTANKMPNTTTSRIG